MSTLGDNILYRRKQLGLTQEELAQRMGYKSKSSINKIELGLNDIPRSKVAKFAEVLGTTPARLMGYSLTIGDRTNKSIARNIKHHREEANLSKEQFADLLGVDEIVVIELESGEKALKKEMLYKICDVLHLIPGNIVPRDEDLTEDEEYLISRREKENPGKIILTEAEKELLEVFRLIPEEQQRHLLETGRLFANSLKKD